MHALQGSTVFDGAGASRVLAKFLVDPATHAGSSEYLHIAAPQLLRVIVPLCPPVPEFDIVTPAYSHMEQASGFLQVQIIQELATAYETTTLTTQSYNIAIRLHTINKFKNANVTPLSPSVGDDFPLH